MAVWEGSSDDRPGNNPLVSAPINEKDDETGLSDVTLSYRKKLVLSGISISLIPGSSTILLGANGAGKTSIIKMLAGLKRPTSGNVQLPNQKSSRQRAVYVFEEPNLYPHISGNSNIRILGGTDYPKLQLACDALGIDRRMLKRSARGYSFGQRRKVTLAAAFATPGHLPVFLDEPTNGLDPSSIAGFLRLATGLRDSGRQLLVTGQDFSTLEALADRVYLLKSGSLEYISDWRKYANASWLLRVSYIDAVSVQSLVVLCSESGSKCNVKDLTVECHGSESQLRALMSLVVNHEGSSKIDNISLSPNKLTQLMESSSIAKNDT